MPWNNLANNQMVSYTDAQGGGFTLKPGQSAVTSNQMMDKTAALAKYNLNVPSMSTYGALQLVPKSAWVIAGTFAIFSFDTTNAGYQYDAKYTSYVFPDYDFNLGSYQNDSRFVPVYSPDTTLVIGSYIYLDAAGTSPICPGEGGDYWYQRYGGFPGSNPHPLIYKIDINSQVESIYTSVYESPNVAPTVPPNFTGARSIIGGTPRYIDLTWDASTDNDRFHHYNLYYNYPGGGTARTIHLVPAVFPLSSGYITPRNIGVPASFPATRMAIRIPSTRWGSVGGGAPIYWWVTAVDISGNESAASNTFTMGSYTWSTPNPYATGQTSRTWWSIADAANGDIYAATDTGVIYKKAAADTTFVATGQTIGKGYFAGAPNGDMYYAVVGGNIYKQANGATTFTTNAGIRNYNGITVGTNGDVYVCVSGGDIYRQAFGTSTFTGMGQTSRLWAGMGTAANGDIYVSVQYTGMFVKPAASSTFVDALIFSAQFTRFSIGPNGDMWVGASNFSVAGDIMKYQTGDWGNGSQGPQFQLLGLPPRNWTDTCIVPNASGYDVYFSVYNGDIYKYTYSNV